jgi:hypothetical protein
MAQSTFHWSLQAPPVLVDHGAGVLVGLDERHLQDPPGLGTEGQEGAVGGPALGPERGQHHRHDVVVVGENRLERGVEAARAVALGRAHQLVVEAEGVEEGAEAGVVVGAEALVGAEGVGHGGERLAQVLGEELLPGHVVGHLAQAVHVVREGDQPGRQVAEHGEGAAHHGGAGDLGEGADVGQTGGSVAGLEHHRARDRGLAAQALEQRLRLLERPGAALQRHLRLTRHGIRNPSKPAGS